MPSIYNSSPGEYKGLITGSLRNPAEVDAIHAHGGTMLWTDGDPHIRFGRLQGRGRADDPTTYEKFIQDEAAEMHSTGDSATLRMADVKKLADIFIDNDASTMQEFFEIVREALGL